MNMYRSMILAAILASPLASGQQIDPAKVVLPLEAQTCNLPNAPMRVPPDADLDLLAEAKPGLTAFQEEMVEYRDCLDRALASDSITDGNRLAINNAYNYSVDMEERMAEQFNIAVRNYKARKAEKQEN